MKIKQIVCEMPLEFYIRFKDVMIQLYGKHNFRNASLGGACSKCPIFPGLCHTNKVKILPMES